MCFTICLYVKNNYKSLRIFYLIATHMNTYIKRQKRKTNMKETQKYVKIRIIRGSISIRQCATYTI